LAPEIIAELRGWCAAEGYAAGTIQQIESTVERLSRWMERRGFGVVDIGDALIRQFAASYGPDTPGRGMVLSRVPAVRRFFSNRGRPALPAADPAAVGAAERELDEWCAWLRDQRGITDGAAANRRGWVAGFVVGLAGDGQVGWDRVDLAMVNAYVAGRGRGYSAASCSLLVTAVRSLLRWALASGRVQADLTGGILRAPATRATLPRGVARIQVDALLAATDPATRVGVRDRAVITMLARLGLRAGEVAGMALGDIDWAAGRLTVVGKGQRRLTLPLPVDVGEALVAWLAVRPADAQDRSVFTRLRAPLRKLTPAGVSDIVVHSSERAGLPPIRAHRLRHTAAMNTIAAGGSLIEAQELLGHQSAETTRVYARTDLASLRALAVPFGKVPQ
jgi:site-specific recombinase XerC